MNIKISLVILLCLLLLSCEYESLHRNIAVSFEATNDEYTVNFTSETNFEGNYFWDFGDGNASEQANPKHQYTASGEYVVNLTFSIKNASVTTSQTVIVEGIELKDIDGNEYRTTQFIGRIWMAENLRTTRCRDGSPVEVLEIGSGHVLRKGMFWHDDNPNSPNSILHGPVYNQSAILNCDVCPEDWHIPTEEEWGILIRNWQNEGRSAVEGLTYAAYQMRMRGNDYWNNNDKATNSSGFSALPGGWLNSESTILGFFGNRVGYWMQDDDPIAVLKIASGDDGTWLGLFDDKECFYIRCIKDLE